jgi:hypothetical protein
MRVSAAALLAFGLGTCLLVAACGTSAHVATSGKSSSEGDHSKTPASRHFSPSSSKTTGLSTKDLSPVIVESIKPEFFQDYSFIISGTTSLSPEVVTAQGQIAAPITPPANVIVANDEVIDLTVAGNSAAPVTINNMTITKKCEAPFTNGTLFYSPSHGAGPMTVAPVYFDLDSSESVGQYMAIPGSTIPSGGNFFSKEVVTLKYHEPETFVVYVLTHRQYCQFSLELSIATVNGASNVSITDNGKDFAVTTDGELETRPTFSSYQGVYAGGFADLQHQGHFIQVNPDTYKGAGDPEKYALH